MKYIIGLITALFFTTYISGSTINLNSFKILNPGSSYTNSSTNICHTFLIDDVTPPTAPTNITASNITATSLDLSWDSSFDNVGVIAYDIYQNGILIGTTSSTNFSVSSLTPNTVYDYSIKAKDAANNTSLRGEVLTVTTLLFNPYPVSLWNHYFEAGLDGWLEGGNDAFRKKNANSPEGQYSFLIRDNSGISSTMTSPVFDASSYVKLEFDFEYTTSSFINGEDFFIQYFDGIEWTTIATYVHGTDFVNNQYYNPTIEISNTTHLFPANAQFRIRCDASNNSDHVYVDAIQLTGYVGQADIIPPSASSGLIVTDIGESTIDLQWNPATDNIGVFEYEVYGNNTLLGKTYDTLIQLQNLPGITTYNLYVVAKDVAGNLSNASNTVVATTLFPTTTTTNIFAHYFESGWDGWNDGGGDAVRIQSPNSYEGLYSLRIRDNSGSSSTTSSPIFDASQYDIIDCEFYFFPNNMEIGEDFWIEFYDSTSWIRIATFVSGTDFQNGNFYRVELDLLALNFNFTTNAQFRITCDASDNDDEIYIDQFIVDGIIDWGVIHRFGPETINLNTSNTKITQLESQLSEISINIFPNPVSNTLNYSSTAIDEIKNIKIYSIEGKMILDLQANKNYNYLDVSHLPLGMYIIVFETDQSSYRNKFIKE